MISSFHLIKEELFLFIKIIWHLFFNFLKFLLLCFIKFLNFFFEIVKLFFEWAKIEKILLKPHTFIYKIENIFTFKYKCLDFKINIFRYGNLIIFALFIHFIKNGITLSCCIIHKILQYFFESIVLNILLVNFFINLVHC
jgi:hypothetical protein